VTIILRKKMLKR